MKCERGHLKSSEPFASLSIGACSTAGGAVCPQCTANRQARVPCRRSLQKWQETAASKTVKSRFESGRGDYGNSEVSTVQVRVLLDKSEAPPSQLWISLRVE